MRRGRFGTVSVRDVDFSGCGTARCLLIDGQVQGGALYDPPAVEVDPQLSPTAPGPCAESAYALGWLLAGLDRPHGTGLMVGLGSGAGAVQLLYNFPGYDLTVLEADPVIAQTALDEFPLIGHYMDRGRLNVVVDDARGHLRGRYDVWDAGFADGYTGARSVETDYLPLLCDRADNIYVNVIDRLGGASMREVWRIMQDRRRPVRQAFRALPFSCRPGLGPHDSSNWILTSEDVDLPRAAAFRPRCQEAAWCSFLGHAMMGLASGAA